MPFQYISVKLNYIVHVLFALGATNTDTITAMYSNTLVTILPLLYFASAFTLPRRQAPSTQSAAIASNSTTLQYHAIGQIECYGVYGDYWGSVEHCPSLFNTLRNSPGADIAHAFPSGDEETYYDISTRNYSCGISLKSRRPLVDGSLSLKAIADVAQDIIATCERWGYDKGGYALISKYQELRVDGGIVFPDSNTNGTAP